MGIEGKTEKKVSPPWKTLTFFTIATVAFVIGAKKLGEEVESVKSAIEKSIKNIEFIDSVYKAKIDSSQNIYQLQIDSLKQEYQSKLDSVKSKSN